MLTSVDLWIQESGY